MKMESIAIAADAAAARDSKHDLSFGGLERSYYLHLPPSYDGSRPFPVVLLFHGGGSNAKSWIDFCGLNETADKQGFIAVYPNGTGHLVEGHEVYGWNGGPHRPGGGGGKLDTTGTIYLSVDHAIKAWTRADGCNPATETDTLPDTAQDGTTATRQTYAGGKEGSEVVLITVNGGGHTWPGRELGPEIRNLLGISSKDFSANDLMWEFFVKHPMR